MRLLKIGADDEVRLTKQLIDDEVPPYAVLSHTWGNVKDEVLYKQMQKRSFRRDTGGFAKIQFCVQRAKADGLSHFWVDSTCIDKSSSAELAEAINSMFDWYREAAKCYVYLSDVDSEKDSVTEQTNRPGFRRSKRIVRYWKTSPGSAFAQSRWFTRGWTLQELLAPGIVEFYSRDGVYIGSKETLESTISAITGISKRALRGHPLTRFSVDE
jgi:hypothetical protein